MLKKTIYTLISLIIALTIWIYIGSIDNEEIDDLGLLDNVINVSDDQNGYSLVSYTQVDGYKLFSDKETAGVLKEHIYHEKWDEAYVQKVLSENQQHIENIVGISNYEYFKFPSVYINNVEIMPAYQHIMALHRLVILKSIHEAKNGNIVDAILLANSSVVISQKIKTGSNNYLLSHMIGLAMQFETILWVHRLVNDHKLDKPQLIKLQLIFNDIHPYHKDSFAEVFSGEYLFVQNFINQLLAQSFSGRWNDYMEHNKIWDVDLFNLLQVLAPRFYIHKNSILNESAKQYLEMKNQSANYCDEVDLDTKEENADFPWYKILKPNLLMDMWPSPISIFSDYFTRRCFSHAYAQGVKTIVALKAYEREEGKLPEKIDALVPDYLQTLPIDPFNGKTLKYSKSNRWVYSVGTNFEDNGGSKDAYYIRRCEKNETCSENLTIPIEP